MCIYSHFLSLGFPSLFSCEVDTLQFFLSKNMENLILYKKNHFVYWNSRNGCVNWKEKENGNKEVKRNKELRNVDK